MLLRRAVILATSIACVALVGCATSRSEVTLASPAAGVTTVQTTGKTAVIRSVKDERQFEQAPGDASTPSLGFEGSAQATAETKLRAIGRKRNTFGKALGDVVLQQGQTVETVVRENLTEALRQAGYRVLDPGSAQPSDLAVDVRIKQFWAWLRPGFVAVTASTNIATDLAIAGRADPTPVSIHHEESRQIVTDGTWIEVVQKALQAYRTEATRKFGAP